MEDTRRRLAADAVLCHAQHVLQHVLLSHGDGRNAAEAVHHNVLVWDVPHVHGRVQLPPRALGR